MMLVTWCGTRFNFMNTDEFNEYMLKEGVLFDVLKHGSTGWIGKIASHNVLELRNTIGGVSALIKIRKSIRDDDLRITYGLNGTLSITEDQRDVMNKVIDEALLVKKYMMNMKPVYRTR